MANEPVAGTAESSAQNNLAEARRAAVIEVFGEKFSEKYFGPIFFIDNARLESPTAIQLFRRDFKNISTVVNYEYLYRSWNGYDQTLLDRYAEIITKKLTSISTMLTNNSNRLLKLMEQSGAQLDNTAYSNAFVVTVPITSGHARSYFNVLKELDRFNLIAAAANILGVIDSTQRAQAEFTCKKGVRAFAAALRNEVIKIYREADRMVREQHSRGTVDAVQQSTVEAQGQELQAFGNAMDTDGKTDRALNLDGTDPSKLIDDAAAASAAPVKRTRKKADDAVTTMPQDQGVTYAPAPVYN